MHPRPTTERADATARRVHDASSTLPRSGETRRRTGPGDRPLGDTRSKNPARCCRQSGNSPIYDAERRLVALTILRDGTAGIGERRRPGPVFVGKECGHEIEGTAPSQES